MFVAFTIILIPTITAFRRFNPESNRAFSGYENYMISNLGYSSTECMNIPVSVGRITLQCPNGKIGQIYDYGINLPDSGSPIDTCLNNNLT